MMILCIGLLSIADHGGGLLHFEGGWHTVLLLPLVDDVLHNLVGPHIHRLQSFPCEGRGPFPHDPVDDRVALVCPAVLADDGVIHELESDRASQIVWWLMLSRCWAIA